MTTPRAFTPAPQRQILRLSGDDRVGFLQGLVSNDVTHVTPSRAIWAALLTPQGKYLADFFILDAGDALLLDIEAGRLADTAARLSRYKLRAKVALAPDPDLAVFLAWGAETMSALELAAPGNARVENDVYIIADPRHVGLGARLVGEEAQIRALMTMRGFRESDFSDWDEARLVLGAPDGTRDLVPEFTILLEAGFNELHGVDWDKGCYVGQELTARTKYRGLIKKRLIPVRLDGPVQPPGTIILQNGRDVGELRSATGTRGLALLRLDALAQEGALMAEETVVIAERPDWMVVG